VSRAPQAVSSEAALLRLEPSVGSHASRKKKTRRVTEAMRWEDDEWELFAGPGPDVPKGSDTRRSPWNPNRGGPLT
jgi:hypothetical protein